MVKFFNFSLISCGLWYSNAFEKLQENSLSNFACVRIGIKLFHHVGYGISFTSIGSETKLTIRENKLNFQKNVGLFLCILQ